MIILLYVEPGFFIHTNDDEFINSKKELKSFEFLSDCRQNAFG